MRWLYSTLDLSANLARALDGCRGLRGMNAALTGVAYMLIAMASAVGAWHYDLSATLEFSNAAANVLIPSLPASVAAYASIILLALTLAPSLVQLFGSRIAASGVRVSQGLLWAVIVFDLVTDWKPVWETMAAVEHHFDALGPLGTPLFLIARILLLAMGSIGFEMCTIIFSVCSIACFIVATATGLGRQGGVSE